MPFTPQDFVSKWKRVTAREKQTYQEHFLDLCRLVSHQTPNEYDHTGTRFAFEMGVEKTSGGQGWADVAKLGYFGWEYKGKKADLEKAYDQLLRYRDSLQNPTLLIVSDIDNIIIRTNYTNLPTRTYTLTLDDLLKPESIEILRTVFFNPEQLKPKETIESVTREAAAKFARLADNLRRYGSGPQEIAHFLIRLLFCLFAEDIGLLPESLFPRLLEQTRRNSTDFSEVLRQLFRAMNTGSFFGSDRILHFNGGLFDNENVLPLESADMDIIADIDSLDWGAIEPSIFGTLFERGLDPSKRSQLGAHYTSKEDILLIVEPVLMAPLRREWEEIKSEVGRMKDELEKEKGKKQEGIRKKISEKLRGCADKFAATTVLDPACGSGNFLYVALRLLLDLQNDVVNFSDKMGAGRFFVSVTPAQLFGIEINEYAHELAQMTIQIGYIQWLRDNGYGQPVEPILKPMKHILHTDAILTYSVTALMDKDSILKAIPGRTDIPLEPGWPPADVIIGNPPFLGGKRMRSELSDQYVDDPFELNNGRVPREADLVCYWFEKARSMLAKKEVKRVGLLGTQGIRGGANRKVLERIKETGKIFWAHADRDWVLDGATVHVSMVGFDNGSESNHALDGVPVATINPDLTTSTNLTIAKTLDENLNLCYMGITPGGAFTIPDELANKWLSISTNPNGKPNSNVFRRYFNGQDIVGYTRGVWIIDFGAKRSLEESAQYEVPFEYVRKHVKPFRDKNKRAVYREKWWLHAESRPAMREAIKDLSRYIATPRVSKHRIFSWIPSSAFVDSAAFLFARDDDYFFGILHSKLHELWARATGTHNSVKRRVAFGIHLRPLLKPSPSPGRRVQNPKMTHVSRPLHKPQKNWSSSMIDGSMPKVSATPTRKRELSRTYTTPVPPGSISPTSGSMRPSWRRMAGSLI